MAVHQARNDGAAAKIDLARRRAGDAAHCAVRAHGDEAAVADGDGLRDRERGIDGDDLAVVEHELRRRARRFRDARSEQANDQRGSAPDDLHGEVSL